MNSHTNNSESNTNHPKSSVHIPPPSLIKQIIRFTIVGLFAFIIDFGLLVFLVEAFHLHFLISASVSFCISLVVNYLLSMRYVFIHHAGWKRSTEFIVFAVLSIIGLVINNYGLLLGVDVLCMDYRLTKLLVTFVVTLWNFISRKIVFPNRFTGGF
jgi:putative flippase GtrA